MKQGIIGLDIDGTLVTQHQPLSEPVTSFLVALHRDGWKILFATGRTVRWSMEHLSSLPFPFFLAPYNGACLFLLPEKQLLASALMDRADVKRLEPFIDQFGAIIYEAGGQERIFYTPNHFSEKILEHLEDRQSKQHERWIPVLNVERIPQISVAGVRFFLSPEAALLLGEAISSSTSLLAPTMKDSFQPDLRIVQVTSRGASKGQALRALRDRYPGAKVIAAGDDMNDIDLIQEADVGIAMGSAPEAVRHHAALVASMKGEDPIIEALKEAIRMLVGETQTEVQERS